MIVHKIIPLRERRKTLTAAYIRVSTKKEEQDGSFEEQKKYYEKRIKSNPEWEFAGLYCERISGTHMEDRPVFKQMVQDAINAKVDLILCKSLSRWARNTVDALETIQILKSQGVRILFEEDNIDTSECGMIMRVAMGSAIAQQESRSISENIKWTYRKRAEHGIYVAQKDKYFGYNTDDGRFTPDENASVVRRIFNEYVNGLTLSEIADLLNDAGIRTLQDREWLPDTVKRVLRNEVYVGDIRFQKKISRDPITGKPDKDPIDKYVENHHDAIVDRSTWNAAQQRLQEYRDRHKKSAGDDEPLRRIDHEVLAMIDDGWSGREISEYLGITIAEEKTCIRRLKRKGLLQNRGNQDLGQRTKRLTELISQREQISISEIMKEMELTRRQASYIVEKMKDQGIVIRTPNGTWTLVE